MPRSHLNGRKSTVTAAGGRRAPRNTAATTAVSAACAVAATLLVARDAHAQRLDEPGQKGHLVFDQISGFRANYGGGLSYYGPVGFSIQKYSFDGPDAGPLATDASSRTVSTTTFFLSPAADYFVIDKLSIGAHLEAAFVSGSSEYKVNPNGPLVTTSDPSRTNIVILPRVGYLVGIGDRWGIWPRGGIGYISQQTLINPGQGETAETFSSALLSIDVGFLYRFNSAVFLRLAPQMDVTLGASHSHSTNDVKISYSASLFQFSVNAGFGVMFDLL